MLLGLYRACAATGNEKVRRVFLRLSCWFGEKVLDRLDDDQVKKMLDCEHGSLPESFADAYREAGEIVGIPLDDHVVIGAAGAHVSMRGSGLVKGWEG